jgi:hypothetical protein
VTRIAAAVCEGKPSLAGGIPVEAFGVLDPRLPGGGASSSSLSASAGSRSQPYGSYLAAAAAAGASSGGAAGLANSAVFRNAFVFVVGGASYAEAHDLQRYAAAAEPRRTLVVGGTEVLQPGTFLGQLDALGRGMS